MSLKSLRYHVNVKNPSSSPLYILGAGSIGLFFASSMQMNMINTNKSSRRANTIPPCLLLRSHHQDKLEQSNKTHFPIDLMKKTSSLSSLMNKLNIIDDGAVRENSELNIDGYVSVAFKNTAGEISLLRIPSKLIEQDLKMTSTSLEESDYIQNILLCTKAPDAVKALKSIMHLLHPSKRIRIIVMTNGSMGVVSDIEQMIHTMDGSRMKTDRIDIIYASTYHGVHRGLNDEDFQHINSIYAMSNENIGSNVFNVLHAGLGEIFIEDKTVTTTTTTDEDELAYPILLSNQWNDMGLRSNLITSDEMKVLNWKKLAANCVINPLTALRQCKNGEILDDDDNDDDNDDNNNKINVSSSSSSSSSTQNEWHYNDNTIFYQLIREVSDIAIAEAQRKDYFNDKTHIDEYIQNFDYENLVTFVKEVVRDTSKNYSSMYQDILHKRHPTEIEYLNGYVAKLGRERYDGLIDVSANEYIRNEIEKLTKSF